MKILICLIVVTLIPNIRAFVHIQAPQNIPESSIKDLLWKYVKPLMSAAGEGAAMEIVIKSPDEIEVVDARRNGLDESELDHTERKQYYNILRDTKDAKAAPNSKAKTKSEVTTAKSKATTSKTKATAASNNKATTTAEPPPAPPKKANNRPVLMDDLERALADLEYRLATGNRVAYMDDLKQAFEELERRHKSTQHATDHNGQYTKEKILQEALQPALKEDLWYLLGFSDGVNKHIRRDGRNEEPKSQTSSLPANQNEATNSAMPMPSLPINPFLVYHPFYVPVQNHVHLGHNGHPNQVHQQQHAHALESYDDYQAQEETYTAQDSTTTEPNFQNRFTTGKPKLNGIDKGVADIIEMLRTGVYIEQIEPSSPEDNIE